MLEDNGENNSKVGLLFTGRKKSHFAPDALLCAVSQLVEWEIMKMIKGRVCNDAFNWFFVISI